jgi:perosamine synthetase
VALTPSASELVIDRAAPVRKALERLDLTGLGFLIVVDVQGVLVGVVTDGDVRRAMLRGVTLGDAVATAMQSAFVSLPATASSAEINDALSDRVSFVPLVDVDGKPVDYAGHARHRRVPVAEPLLDGNEAEYLLECVRSGWISSQGPFVHAFEQAVAGFHDASFALATSSGTTALHLALVSLGVGAGDEVIVPDLTFAATASAVVHAGATPVLVDVDPTTWTLDPESISAALTGRTRAVIPVHLYGHPAEMRRITDVAESNGLFVVEDVAEAFGARAHGRLVGTYGDVACFSFFGNKTITTGEGGMLLFRDEETYVRARRLRDHGMAPDRRYWHLEPGFNYRLTNLQAAVGAAQMERVESILERKRSLAAQYGERLAAVEGLRLPPNEPWAEPVCWLYTVQVTEELGVTRDELSRRLLANGIETRPAFQPLHRMPAFNLLAGSAGDFPVSDRAADSGLSLPSAATLGGADLDEVAKGIRAIADVRRMHIAAQVATSD